MKGHTIAGQKGPLPPDWIDCEPKPRKRKAKLVQSNHGDHKLPEEYPGYPLTFNQWQRYPSAARVAWMLGRDRWSLREISRRLQELYPDDVCKFGEGAIANLFRTLRRRGQRVEQPKLRSLKCRS